MKDRENKQELPQEKDHYLDIPSKANRDKHINFLKAEEEDSEGRNENKGLFNSRQSKNSDRQND